MPEDVSKSLGRGCPWPRRPTRDYEKLLRARLEERANTFEHAAMLRSGSRSMSSHSFQIVSWAAVISTANAVPTIVITRQALCLKPSRSLLQEPRQKLKISRNNRPPQAPRLVYGHHSLTHIPAWHREYHQSLIAACRLGWLKRFCSQLREHLDRYRNIANVAPSR